MITLYGFGPGWSLPEISPYVTKTEVQLKMADLDYHKEQAMPEASPKGQLPYIDDDGELVADSTFIRAHIEQKYAVDLDGGLEARARAEAWAIERMIENQFTWTWVHARWILPANFEKGPARLFDRAPEKIRAQLRQDAQARVAAALHAVGVGRHSGPEIVRLADRSLAALSTLLGDKPYFLGDVPCGLDATAFSSLAGALTPFFCSALRQRAETYGNLVAYVDRMMRRYYPDHPW